MDAQTLSLLSFNARGIRDIKKRTSLFYWLNKRKTAITFLQETYWTDSLSTKLTKEWDGRLIFSAGTEHSRGTAILINKEINLEILNIHKSENSRIILVNCKLEDKMFTMVNIYAPNNSTERKSFFNKLQKWINKYSMNEQEIIIGGDFNYAERPVLDRSNVNSGQHADPSGSTYKTLVSKYNLQDVWRQMHPTKKQFTYKECSRIDKFLLSEVFLDYTQKSNILFGGVKSDHKCIELKLDLNKIKRGPGRWKFNTSILEDKPYIKQIQILIQKTKEEYKMQSQQIIWEMCKIKIRESTIIYCKHKKKSKQIS